MSGNEIAETENPEVVALVAEAASLLAELYDPAGVLIYWSARIKYLDGRRPCDLYAERDVEGLRTLCQRLNALCDGAFA
jgi:hypothetical protein